MPGWTLVVSREEVARAPAKRTFGLPHPTLSDHVLTYVAHDFPATSPMPWRVAPLGVVTATLDLEVPVRRLVAPDPRSGQALPESPVTGLRDRPLTLEQGGASRGIVVTMTPLGAYGLFALPLRELANTTVGLADLLGSDAPLLAERIAETRGWPARFRVLDHYLAGRLRHGPALSAPVHGAWQRITSRPGSQRVAALAEQLGWTRQHLTVRFRHQIGLAPKTVARIARLHHAATMLSRPSPPTRAEVAHRCGYADQPHLNRDFRDLTGCTPGEYLGDARAGTH
ncbi:helix-turn-helix transcriptional regulator [Actinophytocola xanthii]|uniref:AraC family transcriptional regulator n=1 Tax=Actinophytocola xanthii TaxID=1912961 RepID=A0A1Q8CUK8_9PSEU|nr:helix-turn-helix transcriptional regulator [Actinophytocola xanthii]OLF18048.1 AraC family transcriptional regulator [Actinophytocola xanthii]